VNKIILSDETTFKKNFNKTQYFLSVELLNKLYFQKTKETSGFILYKGVLK
jgi:hypothetical protein